MKERITVLYVSIYAFILSIGVLGNAHANSGEYVLHKDTRVNGDTVSILEKYISIDNVCAWPNLTQLDNGSVIATIFNQPSHGRGEGDVETWVSEDGRFWDKQGTPTNHEPGTNRMNVAAGLSASGDLIVLTSGWELKKDRKGKVSLVKVLRPWVSRSSDHGSTWKTKKNGFPTADKNMTNFIPFGDILQGEDGSLRAIGYAQSQDKVINKTAMFRSDDDGSTWKKMSMISDGSDQTSKGHNETALFYLGQGEWIAAARRWKSGQSMDLFRSTDDGKSWVKESQLTNSRQHPGHLLRLEDGRLLLTYGNRVKDQYGVAVKISEDHGRTWGDEMMLFSQKMSVDIGYPSSVQQEDGTIITAYYASREKNHDRYHMGTVIWELK